MMQSHAEYLLQVQNSLGQLHFAAHSEPFACKSSSDLHDSSWLVQPENDLHLPRFIVQPVSRLKTPCSQWGERTYAK